MKKTGTSASTGARPAAQWQRRLGSALCVALAAAGLLTQLPATAGDLGVDPVLLELSPRQRTVAIKITNSSGQPTAIQTQAVTWSQVDGKDVYTPTKELLVSPPIVTIAPNSEQIIRVALRRAADSKSELAYRIFLQQLPVPPAPGVQGVQVALRIGLPVFVKPQQGKAAPKMVWSAVRMPENTLKVTMHNQGNAHVQISDFEFSALGADKPVAGQSGSSYVLAGQTRDWLLKENSAVKTVDGRLRLKAYTDAGEVDVVLLTGNP